MKKIFASFLILLLTLTSLSTTTSAATIGLSNNNDISPMSYNSSFTLDFSASTAWTLNFNNNAFMMFNHKKVSIQYISCSPSNTSATVRVELYIDEDEDGIYELYDPSGGYGYTLKVGETLVITLPHGNTVKNYRLYFKNRTSSVKSGTFSVKTS